MAVRRRRTAPPVESTPTWDGHIFLLHERVGPRGRRLDVLSGTGNLVTRCRVRRGEAPLVLSGPDGTTAALELRRTQVRGFARAYEAMDVATGQKIGQLRRRAYADDGKSEWFIVGPDGEAWGLIAETPHAPSLLRRVVPRDPFWSKAWALHWGQSIAGNIQPQPGLVKEGLEIDLSLDQRGAIDRRLALATLIAMRVEDRLAETPPARAP